MDRWERTKVGAAVILAVGVLVVGNWVSGLVFDVHYPERQGYPIEGVAPVDLAAAQRSWPGGLSQPGEEAMLRGYMAHIDKAVLPVPATGIAAPTAAAPVDLGTLLASADAERGKGTAKMCASCHTFEQGGANRVGPNLWGVVGRDVGGTGGFAYSPAVAGHARRLDLSGAGPLSGQPSAGDPRQQDGLQRRQEPEGPRQSTRLPGYPWRCANAISAAPTCRGGTKCRENHFVREITSGYGHGAHRNWRAAHYWWSRNGGKRDAPARTA